MRTLTKFHQALRMAGLATLLAAPSTQPARAELAEWISTVNNNAAQTKLVYLNTTMITSAMPAAIPAVTGDRTYEFICHLWEPNTGQESVALMGDGSFAYKFAQYRFFEIPVAGSTRYGVSDDYYTPLNEFSTRLQYGWNILHYVVQADGTGLLYVDGTLRGTMAAGKQPVLSGNVMIGAGNSARKDAMGAGCILGVAVYDSALSSSEVGSRKGAWGSTYDGPPGLATEIRKDKPAHWWRLNEQFATQTAADSGLAAPVAGSYLGGCLPGQAALNADAGTAVRLAGNEFADPGRIVIPNLPQWRRFTLEAWMYLDADASAFYFPVLTHETPEAYTSLVLAPYPNRMRGTFNVLNDISAEEFGAPLMSRGRWHHVAIIQDGGLTVYVDGSEFYAASAPLNKQIDNGTATGPLTIGSLVGGLFNFGFKGVIDEVVMYPYRLAYGRIQAHYTAAGGVMPLSWSAHIAESDEPYNGTEWSTTYPPVDFDVGRLATLSVAPGSPAQPAPESGPLSRLLDGELGDDGLDSTNSTGPNGRADGFFFADSDQNTVGRLLMTFNEPVGITHIRIWAGADKALHPWRSRLAGKMWVASSPTLPPTGGDIEFIPAWRKLAVMWTRPHNQTWLNAEMPMGNMGPVKYLLFEFDTAGDSQFDVLREIDVRGGPLYSGPDLQIEKIAGRKVRLSWKAEYENWFLLQGVHDGRYGWTSTFLPQTTTTGGFRTWMDYEIPTGEYWPEKSKRSMFRMHRWDPAPVP